MTDDQAERLIKELKNIRGTLLGIAICLVVGACAMRIGDTLAPPNPTAGIQSELSAIRAELMKLRPQQPQGPFGGSVGPSIVPANKVPEKDKGKP